jgi:YebC/PmpR family DNA-binding regulatory protein
MSRHWNNIKYDKAAKDASRSKNNAKFGLEIYVAAKSEPDPALNRKLQEVIAKAKTYNVPRDIIERAIDRAKGSSDVEYAEIRYEGYGPSGSAIVVDCLTDNVNRTVSFVRSAFSKHGGTLGVSGSVSFLFESIAIVAAKGVTEDQVLEACIENDVDAKDIEADEEGVTATAAPSDFNKLQEAFKSIGVTEFETCELSVQPLNAITLNEDAMGKFGRLMDALEESDDVQNVYHNVEM